MNLFLGGGAIPTDSNKATTTVPQGVTFEYTWQVHIFWSCCGFSSRTELSHCAFSSQCMLAPCCWLLASQLLPADNLTMAQQEWAPVCAMPQHYLPSTSLRSNVVTVSPYNLKDSTRLPASTCRVLSLVVLPLSQIPEESGPQDDDPSTVHFPYYSTVDLVPHQYSGLVGVFVVAKPGSLAADGSDPPHLSSPVHATHAACADLCMASCHPYWRQHAFVKRDWSSLRF